MSRFFRVRQITYLPNLTFFFCKKGKIKSILREKKNQRIQYLPQLICDCREWNSHLSDKPAQEAFGPRERIGFGLRFERKTQWVINPERREAGSSQVPWKKWVTQKIISRGDGKMSPYPKSSARLIHVWFPGNSWNHGKVLELVRRLKIFTSAWMMGLLPQLYRIKYKWDNLNSTNNLQNSEFCDKGGEIR